MGLGRRNPGRASFSPLFAESPRRVLLGNSLGIKEPGLLDPGSGGLLAKRLDLTSQLSFA